jgi:glycosyltransferase involved in cell wall biosynthesis
MAETSIAGAPMAGVPVAGVPAMGVRPAGVPAGVVGLAGVPGVPAGGTLMTGSVVAEVVFPCLDEAAALPYVLGRLPSGYRAIVVDNGSSDGSAEIARRLGAQVVHEPRRGFGAACHAGLRSASADVVCFCDCDGSLDPAELPMVVGPIRDGDADLVLGRRRPASIRAWPPHARTANLLLAHRIRRATGTQLRDLGPMRAARREWLLALGLRDRRFGYPLEMVLAAARAGWRIIETDVRYVPRTGRSKVTGTLAGTLRAVRDMRKAWKGAIG